MPDKGVPDQKSEALLRSRKQSGASKKDKKKQKPPTKGEHAFKTAFKSFSAANNEFSKAEAVLDRMIDRETATKTKFDKLMNRYKILKGYFAWFATHATNLQKPEARDALKMIKDAIKSLKSDVEVV